MSSIESIDWTKIKVISFDLDDTIWDNSGVIEKCLAELYQFLCDKEPLIEKHFTVQSMERITEQLIQLDKPEYENMTVLRKAVIRQMLTEVGGDLALINPAFSVFYYWRNQIKIPNKSLQVLKQLKRKFILVATSNGNSNLNKIGLADYFEEHLIAGVHGRAKPSPEMLQKILAKFQISTEQLIHIGDNYESDIMSARNASLSYLQLDFSRVNSLLKINM